MQSYNNWRRLQKRRGMQVRREGVMGLLGKLNQWGLTNWSTLPHQSAFLHRALAKQKIPQPC